MLTTIYETRKNNVFLMIQCYPSRQDFADKIDIAYNLLNQYLGKKNPKNIGDKLANKITSSHNLSEGWLDHPHDIATIKSIINTQPATNSDVSVEGIPQIEQNHSSIDSGDMSKIITFANQLKIAKGEILEVTNDVKEVKQINFPIPTSIKNPIAYLIVGSGYTKPYKNGYGIVCEFTGKPVAGEEVLIFCKNDQIFAGEFLFENSGFIDIDSIDGEREQIAFDDIARISPIKYFISPSQIT